MKVLVDVSVPVISKRYDVLVPDFLLVQEAANLIASAVEKLSNNMYVSSGRELLCSAESEQLLQEDVPMSSYGIKNGDHLILF